MYTQTSGCRSYTAPEGPVLGTYAVLDAVTHNDVDVRLRVRSNFNGSFLQAGTIGLMFGHQDNNNFYRLDLSQRSGHRKLMKRVGGVSTELATSPQSYKSGEWTNVRIVRQNGVIIVFVNDEQALTAEDSAFSSGRLACSVRRTPQMQQTLARTIRVQAYQFLSASRICRQLGLQRLLNPWTFDESSQAAA